jgi:hypothetical protein
LEYFHAEEAVLAVYMDYVCRLEQLRGDFPRNCQVGIVKPVGLDPVDVYAVYDFVERPGSIGARDDVYLVS